MIETNGMELRMEMKAYSYKFLKIPIKTFRAKALLLGQKIQGFFRNKHVYRKTPVILT